MSFLLRLLQQLLSAAGGFIGGVLGLNGRLLLGHDFLMGLAGRFDVKLRLLGESVRLLDGFFGGFHLGRQRFIRGLLRKLLLQSR